MPTPDLHDLGSGRVRLGRPRAGGSASRRQRTMVRVRDDLLGLTFTAFAAWARGLVGHSDRHHSALYRHLMRSGRFAPDEVPEWADVPATARAALAAAATREQTPVVGSRVAQSDPDRGTTSKTLARLRDGAEVETVVIPMRGGRRHTTCVSSQVGCRMGCAFCHTARMGLVRSLAPHEIVGQAVLAGAARDGDAGPRNVVFMGMGEPLDNAEAVAQAVRVLTDPHGLGLAHRHITISTVGRVDGLARLAELGLDRVRLAVSLGAADDALRSELMPVNRTAPLAELKRALLALGLGRDRRILVSYVVIPGVNDGEEHVARLLAWLDGLPAQLNLIPYNPIPSRPWRAPTADEIAALRARLGTDRVAVRLRTTKGDAVMAACGQLGDPAKRRTAGAMAVTAKSLRREADAT